MDYYDNAGDSLWVHVAGGGTTGLLDELPTGVIIQVVSTQPTLVFLSLLLLITVG